MARIARSAVDRVRVVRASRWVWSVRSPSGRSPPSPSIGPLGVWLVAEMSIGQMIEDVRLAVEGRAPVEFYGRVGGMVPSPVEIASAIRTAAARKEVAPA